MMLGKRMRVAIIGVNGQLGSDLAKEFARTHDVIGITHDQLDITDFQRAKEVLLSAQPSVVLNTAAFHVVPACETEPQKAFDINALGAKHLAQLSQEIGYTLVQYSTNYVFDGNKKTPYHEGDAPNPLNVYGVTKLAGESFVRNYSEKHYVLRISGIYGSTPCRAKGENFITKIIKMSKERPQLKIVDDEVLTPTPTHEIARQTIELIKSNAYGLYHMTCEGECSWFEFAAHIFKTLQISTPLVSCKSHEFPSSVKRPLYSALENFNMKSQGINSMPHWTLALDQFLREHHQ